MEESFTERVARVLAEEAAAQPPPQEWDPALIPEAPDSVSGPRTPDDIDRILGNVDILQAYDKWCGKMQPDPKGKRESIMISCPRPDHADEHPSAYANLDKNVYHCGACNEGGDIYTIAGYHFGLDPKSQFRELRQQMAVDLGYTVTTTSGLSVVEQTQTTQQPLDNVVDFTQFLPDVPGEIPGIDWQTLFPNDTFMRRWMEITSQDDLPNEYYVWLGLAALGLAVGKNVVLDDSPDVTPNLYLCMYGRSGVGKTRSVRALSELLRLALPYDHNDFTNNGVQLVPEPGSAEALVDSFARVETDPVTRTQTHHPVRGLVRFDELSTFIGKSARLGSVLKPTLMEFFDSYEPVRMKTRGTGLVVAEGHFCSVITTTQPGSVRNLLVRNDAESGFVNRWIFVCGPEKKAVAYRRNTMDLTPCVSLLQGIKAWSSTKHRLVLETDALTLFDEFFDKELEPVRKAEESNFLTRCDLHLKKIITLLTIDEKLTNPTREIVERALSLFGYLVKSYALVGAEIGTSPFQDAYDATLKAIQHLEDKLGNPPKRRDICRKIGRAHDADMTARVLKVMEQLGVVEVSSTVGPSGRGQPIITYHYVP